MRLPYTKEVTEHGDHTTIKFLRLDQQRSPKKQAVLLVMTGPTTGQTVYLESRPLWRLGRALDADLPFQDESVSRQHCQISLGDGKWMIQDMNSANGTWVNGDRIDKTELRANDKIQIGSSIIVKFVLQDEIEASFQKELYESATRDALTGLHSKRFFIEQLNVEFNYHRRVGRPLTVTLLDVDHFKKINDTHGHAAGDMVLKQLGGLFLNILRKGDICGRYGGEEIAFCLRDTPLVGGKHFSERLRRLIETHSFVFDEKKIPVTASAGVATFTSQNLKSADDLIKEADRFLYKAKNNGRNRVECLIQD